MTILKRVLCLVISIIFILTCVACEEEEKASETQATETATVEQETEVTEKATKKPYTPSVDNAYKVYSKNLSQYEFVIAEKASNSVLNAAKSVSTMAKELWSSSGTLKKDNYASASAKNYEVLVGATNRPESKEYIDTLKKGEGGYAVIGEKIVVAGYSDAETVSAMSLFYATVMTSPPKTNNVYVSSLQNVTDDLSSYISVMSFNVYVGIGGDQEKKENALKIIRAYNPDVFGVQEASAAWQTTLKNEFQNEYTIIGEPRETGGTKEAVQIFIKKSRFEVISSGTKWLTATPDKISKTDGAECYRNVTYAVIGTKEGKVFNYVNTHLDHVNDENVRVTQIGYLNQILKSKTSTEYPTFITGDFNMLPNGQAYKKMVSLGYKPSYEISKKNYSVDKSTFKHGGIIDYCFVSNSTDVETCVYKVCDENIYGENSDHNAVYTVFKY